MGGFGGYVGVFWETFGKCWKMLGKCLETVWKILENVEETKMKNVIKFSKNKLEKTIEHFGQF